MKAYWVTAGIGTLVTVVGGLMWVYGQRDSLASILMLGGIVVAIMGLIMRFLAAYMGEKPAH